MKECYIFSGAGISDYSFVQINEASYIICADGGYHHVKRLGIRPDVVIGDFDTLNLAVTDNCEIIKYPCEKDDTDTMLAIKLAIGRGFDDIKIFGAIGGRLDHTIANIQALAYVRENNAAATIFGENEVITILKNGMNKYQKLEGFYFSIFSFSEKSFGVSTTGLKYNLNNAVLTNTFPLGVSNEIIEDFCEIEVKTGTLLIIFSKQ